MAKFYLCFLFFLSFLFSSCSHTPMNTEEARAYLLDAQQHIERIRENNRHRYARELEKSERMLTARQTQAPLADLNALKKQATIYGRVIVAAMLRYQVDLELLAYSESVQNDVREALKILRNASLPRPENLSAYLTETELAEFETETADMRSRSRQRLEFWTKERTKWQKAWDSGSTDYVPPPHQPDVFRFNYDDGRKLRQRLRMKTSPASPSQKNPPPATN